MLTETSRNHYGPVDSLGKLFYKSCIKHGCISYEQLLEAAGREMIQE
jgi:hypothetical protein